MDFAALPPEINSARIYAGPGAAPMMAAASAWSSLGAELSTAAASYESVITTLTGDEWLGTASATMSAAVAPFVGWMNATAAAAERAATQAMASAAAYQAAFTATVPPPVIAANRVALATLIATNIIGQNTAAIAANEALYGEMWAQDAAAMYAYAGVSATAGVLTPLTEPASIANPSGPAAQATAVTQAIGSAGNTQLAQLVAGLPNAVQGLASPLAAEAAVPMSVQNLAAMAGNIGAWNMFAAITAGVGLNSANGGDEEIVEEEVEAVIDAEEARMAPTLSAVSLDATRPLGGTPVLASLGQGAPVGGLSVPGTWAAATPATPAVATTLGGSGWTAGVEEGGSVLPAGMPAAGVGGRSGMGFGAPRYGVKPIVMPRPIVVG